MHRLLTALLFCSLLSVQSTYALVERADFSGFGSIGGATTSSDDVLFRRDVSDPEGASKGEINLSSLSVLGLQTNLTFNQQWQFIGQVILRDHPEQDTDNILRLATLNYSPTDSWQFRFGRTSQRIYMLSDSRSIGYANLWTMPVQEFYSMMTYNFLDGIDATYSHPVTGGYARVNLSYGKSTVSIYDQVTGPIKLKFGEVGGINFEYERDNWLARISWATAAKAENWQQLEEPQQALLGLSQQMMWEDGSTLANALLMEDKQVSFISAGFCYDNGNITLRGELGKLDSEALMIPKLSTGYLSIGKHFGDFTPYMVFAKVDSEPVYSLSTVPPPPIAPLVSALLDDVLLGYKQSSVSLGLRWDLNYKSALKLQWDRKSVSNGGYGLWLKNDSGAYPQSDQDIDVLSMRFDFIF